MGRKRAKKARPLDRRGGYTTTKKADLSKLKFSKRPAGHVTRLKEEVTGEVSRDSQTEEA